MGEGNESGSEDQVQERNVGKDGDQDGFEEETEVGVHVSHLLLGDGKVSGLADKEIGPLDANDGNKVSTLSVMEGFSGVADIVVSDSGSSEEIGGTVSIIPSALRPGGSWESVIEKSDINHSVLEGIPVKESSIGLNGISSLGVTLVQETGSIDISSSRHVTSDSHETEAG